MKKSILTFLFFICIPLNTYASWCLIKWWPAEFLLEYIENNQIVLDNIWAAEDKSKWISKNRKEFISRMKSEAEGVFNDAFSYRSYKSYFKYFAVFPALNEIPVEVKRDYKLLKDEINIQIEFLKEITQEWKWSFTVEDPCAWVSWICNFSKNVPVSQALWELLKNSDNVIDTFRWTVVWERYNMKVWDLHLVNNNFKLEMEKYYSPKAYNLCNWEWEWYRVTVKEVIERIKWLTTAAEDWIKEWKEAWAMLYWTTPSKEAELEKKLLKEYLAENWIKTDDSAVLNKNLNKYGVDSLSLNNNFITNTFRLIENEIATETENFAKEVISDFVTKEEMSHEEIKARSNNSIKTQSIQADITRLYETEIPFAAMWDLKTETLRAKIIETHSSLDVSIRVLNRAIPKSQKICNSQWWGWLCN